MRKDAIETRQWLTDEQRAEIEARVSVLEARIQRELAEIDARARQAREQARSDVRQRRNPG